MSIPPYCPTCTQWHYQTTAGCPQPRIVGTGWTDPSPPQGERESAGLFIPREPRQYEPGTLQDRLEAVYWYLHEQRRHDLADIADAAAWALDGQEVAAALRAAPSAPTKLEPWMLRIGVGEVYSLSSHLTNQILDTEGVSVQPEAVERIRDLLEIGFNAELDDHASLAQEVLAEAPSAPTREQVEALLSNCGTGPGYRMGFRDAINRGAGPLPRRGGLMPFFGDCPYPDCDGLLVTPEPEVFDRVFYHKGECEECERVVWTRMSRIESWSATEADFLAKYDVDEASKKITERVPVEPKDAE